MDKAIKFGVYRHFKGGLYKVIDIAQHTETNEWLVIYKEMYGNKTWARPVEMFTSKVDRDRYPDAAQEYRFEYIRRD